ncbi:MAG TPA: murein biosynthesis integral membrane protein MurJ [Pseudolabrys sp.]
MSLARDITTVGGGTLMSRLLAYLRDAWIAALLGAGPYAEGFFIVLQVVNFFRRLLSEGALNSAFVPIWLKLRAGEDGAANAHQFTVRAMVVVGTVTGIVVLIATVFAPFIVVAIAPGFGPAQQEQTGFLLMIVAPYILLAGLVAVGAAALSAEGRVFAVAVSTVMFNLVLLLALAIVARRSEQIWTTIWLVIAIVIAGFVQLLIAIIALAAGPHWQRIRVRAPDETRNFFRRALPGLIATGIPQLKLIAATAIVSVSPAAVSWLYYANRLYELPLGVASIAIAAVIVPRIAAGVHAGDDATFIAEQSRAYEIALGLALPAAVGFAVLADPIAGGLFQRGAFTEQDTAAVAAALTAICAGLPGHVLEKVFGAVSFAHEDTQTPMVTACAGLATAIVGGILVFPHYGYVGVAVVIAISGWVGAILLGLVLQRRGWLKFDANAMPRLTRIVLAAALMGGVVACSLASIRILTPAAATSSAGRLITLFVLVTLGVAIYGAALRMLGIAKLKDFAAAARMHE